MYENERRSMENQDRKRKLSSLAHGLVKIFAEVTTLSGDNKTDKGGGVKYDTEIVQLLLLLFYADVLLLLLFADAVQKSSSLTLGLVARSGPRCTTVRHSVRPSYARSYEKNISKFHRILVFQTHTKFSNF